jgi:hypothetical protein
VGSLFCACVHRGLGTAGMTVDGRQKSKRRPPSDLKTSLPQLPAATYAIDGNSLREAAWLRERVAVVGVADPQAGIAAELGWWHVSGWVVVDF